MIKKLFRYLVLTLFVSLVIPLTTFASFLTISGENKLSIKKDSTGLRINGTVMIRNSGDETAYNVRPVLMFEKIRTTALWGGEQQSIDSNQSYTWTVDYLLPAATEYKGAYPVYVKFLYEDRNGYKFTAPSVLSLNTPELGNDELVNLYTNKLNPKAVCEPSGQAYKCTVTMLNRNPTPIQATVQLFTTDELVSTPENLEIAIPPAPEETRVSFAITNFSALIGSTYPVVVGINWKQDGLNNFISTISSVKIEEISPTFIPIVIGVLVVLVLIATIVLIRLKPRSKTS
jgi:hypothetical protein